MVGAWWVHGGVHGGCMVGVCWMPDGMPVGVHGGYIVG